MPSILLTRTQDDCDVLRPELEAMGYDVLISPLLHIEHTDNYLPAYQQTLKSQAIDGAIFTSRHAIAPATQTSLPFDTPCYAVGEHTSLQLRNAGFTHIHTFANAAKLADALLTSPALEGAHLVYFSGEHVRTDLPALCDGHLQITRIITYKAVLAEALSPDAVEALSTHSLDVISLMSPRTAHHFGQLLHVHDLYDATAQLSCFCFGEAVEDAAHTLGFAACYRSENTDLASLLALAEAYSIEAEN